MFVHTIVLFGSHCNLLGTYHFMMEQLTGISGSFGWSWGVSWGGSFRALGQLFQTNQPFPKRRLEIRNWVHLITSSNHQFNSQLIKRGNIPYKGLCLTDCASYTFFFYKRPVNKRHEPEICHNFKNKIRECSGWDSVLAIFGKQFLVSCLKNEFYSKFSEI